MEINADKSPKQETVQIGIDYQNKKIKKHRKPGKKKKTWHPVLQNEVRKQSQGM